MKSLSSRDLRVQITRPSGITPTLARNLSRSLLRKVLRDGSELMYRSIKALSVDDGVFGDGNLVLTIWAKRSSSNSSSDGLFRSGFTSSCLLPSGAACKEVMSEGERSLAMLGC